MIQISVFLPNVPGEFSKFLDLFIKHDIEIRAVTVAENEEYGLLLLLVNKPDECVKLLEEKDFPVATTDVIAIKVESENNTLFLKDIANTLGKNNVNIEYMYSTLVKNESLIIMRVDDNERAKEILKGSNFKLEERETI